MPAIADLERFNRDLALALEHGASLSDALHRVGASIRDGALREAVARAAAAIEGGQDVARAFEAEGQAFPAEYVALIRAGLAGGNLGAVLRLHAGASGHLARGRQKLFSAAGYPFIVLAALAAFCFLMAFLTVPEIRDCMLSLAGGDTSQVHFLAWGFQLFYFVVGCAAVVGVGLFVLVFLRTASRQSSLAKVLRFIPGGSYLMDLWSSAATLRALAAYIGAGIPLTQGLQLCAAPQLLEANRLALEQAAREMEKGSSPALAAEKIAFLPPVFSHLLDNAGPQLQQELSLAAEAADADFDDFRAAHNSTMQVALLGAVGLLTALVLAAFVVLYTKMIGAPR